MDDLKERRGYSNLKEEALDRRMWRVDFGRGFGPIVRETTKLMTEIYDSNTPDSFTFLCPIADIVCQSLGPMTTAGCFVGWSVHRGRDSTVIIMTSPVIIS
jgi:hypothetical protein